MQNDKIFYLLRKRDIKQVYGRFAEDLKRNIKLILKFYANRVDDLIDSLDDNEMEKDLLFHLNNEIYYCK